MADRDNELEKISNRLNSIESRLSKLESALDLSGNKIKSDVVETTQAAATALSSGISDSYDEDKGLESQIGRFGLAWMGNVVLLFGIIFLIQFLMSQGYKYLPLIVGYIASLSIFFLAGYLKKTNSHLSFIFKIHAHVLFYYVTLHLHFFSPDPVLPGKTIAVVLVLMLVAVQAYISIRDKSQAIAALSVIFLLTTAISTDSTHLMLSLVILTAVGAVYLYYRFHWSSLLLISIFLTYITFIMWLFGNPFMGHPMQMISVHNNGVLYLFGLGTCFSFMSLFRKKDDSSDDFLISVIIINGILFTLLLALVVLRFYSTNYVVLFAVITVFCLVFSTILHSESDWNFASAFFALYGFMAMSISLYGLFGFPRVYLLLSVQSLLVVSMALWFGNRLIVVMNSLLFLTILLIYLLSSKPVSGVNFSFALISLLSARIINWKKSRLQIKTDLLRNMYMIEGFFMVLFALFHAIPRQFVTFSWTIAAMLYFLISLLLKNVKYRYMALGALICAAVYLFIVDLARIELIYRILALLFLATLSIGISIYYTQRNKKHGNQDQLQS
jgi:hypothetical protein